MKKLILPLILSSLIFSFAYAEETPSNPFDNNSNLTTKEKKDKKTAERKLKASRRACEIATDKQRLDGADYVAGVDVRGNSVVSADLAENGYGFEFPDEVEFDLSLSPFQSAGLTDLEKLFPNSSFSLGKIKYSVSRGELTYNGKVLSDEQNRSLSEACQAFQKLKKDSKP